MIKLLPAPKKKAVGFLLQLFHRVKGFFRSKKLVYKLATALDLILIALILINGKQPAQNLISPFVSSFSSLQSFYPMQEKLTKETFAFVPDLARNKFPHIDLEGLTALSFFDVPLNQDGEINFDSRGYASFASSEAWELFERARYQKTKIFLTLSSFDEGIIRTVLNNPQIQQNLASQAIEEIRSSNIDGVTIDFEIPKERGNPYQKKFTDFIKLLTDKIHSELPYAQVAVAVPSSLINDESLYALEPLSKSADRLFLIASDFAVPEVKNSKASNPVFGFNGNEYWEKVSNLLNNLSKKASSQKLVMERAWYGNGDDYPLYIPKSNPPLEEKIEPSEVVLDQDTIERLVDGVPYKGKAAARKNIPLIAKALERENILDSNVLAYALATIEHETDETFEPIEEIQGRVSARRLGYEGGMNYFGRGFIQLTHLRNYKEIGKRIGMGEELVKHPELASSPEIAAKILAAFFKDNNVANLASRGNFVTARRPINPDYNGYSVANLAMKYGI